MGAAVREVVLGGRINVCFNCVDRHVEAGQGEKIAYYWEGEPEDERRTITFADLQREVCRFANALRKLGVKKGDGVAIYMPWFPRCRRDARLRADRRSALGHLRRLLAPTRSRIVSRTWAASVLITP